MKIGQLKQYREKLAKSSPAELAEELVKLRKEQFSLRMQRATGQTPEARAVRQCAPQHRARRRPCCASSSASGGAK